MKAGGGAWHGGKGKGTGPQSGFQLWISLPPGIEEEASESLYASPGEVKGHGTVKVLLGSHGEAKSPFETPASMNYYQVSLKDGESWHYEPPCQAPPPAFIHSRPPGGTTPVLPEVSI